MKNSDIDSMVKLHILSDLHLEFSTFEPLVTDADVIILAGDIGKGSKGVYWARETCSDMPTALQWRLNRTRTCGLLFHPHGASILNLRHSKAFCRQRWQIE